MNSWKLGFALLFGTIPLVGCNLTEDEKNRIDTAEDNVEKIALAPQITKPSEDETISGLVDVYVDVDESAIDQYKSMTLFIEGTPELVDEDYPFEFTFDSYFWSTNEKISLLAKLETVNGNQLRSEVISIPVDPSARDAIKLSSPTAGAQLQDTDQVLLQWNAPDTSESYEYRINGGDEQPVQNTEVTLSLYELGSYTLELRATDANGHTGAWSTPTSFALVPPALPVVENVSTNETDEAFSVNILFQDSDTSATTQVQISTSDEFNDTEVLEAVDGSLTVEQVAGVYHYRVRAINQYGHTSEWSSPKEVQVGMFAYAVNLASSWDNWDSPVDLVVDENDLAIVSRKGPSGDGSGDDFYVSKVDYSDGYLWGKSYSGIISSANSISSNENGYLLTGRGVSNYRDGLVLAIGSDGQFQWLEKIESEVGELDGLETYTQHTFYDAESIGDGKYIIAGSETKRQKTGQWNSNLIYKKNMITLLDRTNSLNTSEEIVDPVGGEYDYINDLLVTSDTIYAAGRFTKDGATGDSSDDGFEPTQSESGALLLKISKTDGSISESRTAGGFTNRYSGDLLQSTNGEIYVSYSSHNKAGVSVFDSNNQSTSFFKTAGMQYGYIAGGENSILYMVGPATNDYLSPFVVKYDNGVEIDRANLNGYSTNLDVKAVMHHKKFGTIVLGVDEGQVGYDYSDDYTVLFNITDDLEFITPSELIVDYGN